MLRRHNHERTPLQNNRFMTPIYTVNCVKCVVLLCSLKISISSIMQKNLLTLYWTIRDLVLFSLVKDRSRKECRPLSLRFQKLQPMYYIS